MKRPVLKLELRTLTGKKVKNLRRDGILPANIYGKDIASIAVQLPLREFTSVFSEVGETGLVDLHVDGQTRPVLIKNVHFTYPERTPLHADFHQVNLKEKVKSMVPLEIVGEAKAVAENLGVLLQTLSEVEVEALPADLPEKFEVNVEHLAVVDEQITVEELKAPADVAILTDPTRTIVKIGELVVEEPEPTEEEAAEGTEGATDGEAESPASGSEENAEENKEAAKEE